MAFGGVAAFAAPAAARGSLKNRVVLTGVTLAARVGNFDPTGAAADSALLSTDQAVVVNQQALPASFGFGPGGYVAGDEALITVEADGDNGAAILPDVYVASIAVAAGNLQIGLHNRGAGVSGNLRVVIEQNHSITQ